MDNNLNYSQEELQKLLEKAQRELQENLSQLSPEERALVEARAQKMMAEEDAERQRIFDAAAKVSSCASPTNKPKTCKNCGAPAGSGAFCEYCGTPY